MRNDTYVKITVYKSPITCAILMVYCHRVSILIHLKVCNIVYVITMGFHIRIPLGGALISQCHRLVYVIPVRGVQHR